MLKAVHCGICVCVCVYLCILCLSSNAQAVLILSIYSFQGQKFCCETHQDFLDEADRQKAGGPILLPSPPSQQSHFLTSNTLLFQLLCVYGELTEYPLLHGELARPYPLKLYSAINSSMLQTSAMSCYMLLAPNYPAVPASRPPAFPWHQSSGDLTRATLSWRLSLELLLVSAFFALSLSFVSIHLSQELVWQECCGIVRAPTWTQRTSKRKARGEEWDKGYSWTYVDVTEVSLSD